MEILIQVVPGLKSVLSGPPAASLVSVSRQLPNNDTDFLRGRAHGVRSRTCAHNDDVVCDGLSVNRPGYLTKGSSRSQREEEAPVSVGNNCRLGTKPSERACITTPLRVMAFTPRSLVNSEVGPLDHPVERVSVPPYNSSNYLKVPWRTQQHNRSANLGI